MKWVSCLDATLGAKGVGATVVQVGIDRGNNLVHQVGVVGPSGVSGSARSIVAVGSKCLVSGAVVPVRIDAGVHLVHQVGVVRTGICAGVSSHASSHAGVHTSARTVGVASGSMGSAAVVHIRVNAGIDLVGKVGRMRTLSTSQGLVTGTVIHVGINARVDLVHHARVMGASVGAGVGAEGVSGAGAVRSGGSVSTTVVHVTVNPGVHLVGNARAVRAMGTTHGLMASTVVHVRVNAWVDLV